MTFLYTLVKAVIQALTEFLPVSSSAHLILTHQVFVALNQPVPSMLVDECYDVFLHVGTLLAVVVYFRKELVTTWQAAWSPSTVPNHHELSPGLFAKPLPLYIIATTSVTVLIVGSVLLLSPMVLQAMGLQTPEVTHLVDYYRAHPHWVGWHLMATGLILLTMERWQAQRLLQQFAADAAPHAHKPVTLKTALILGLVQSCSAVFRGVSRSGAALAGGLACGLSRVTAARYAFLMGIPAFVLAAGYASLKLTKANAWGLIDWPMMFLGLVVTALVGYGVIALFLRLVGSHRLVGFGWYCLGMGAFLAYWLR